MIKININLSSSHTYIFVVQYQIYIEFIFIKKKLCSVFMGFMKKREVKLHTLSTLPLIRTNDESIIKIETMITIL